MGPFCGVQGLGFVVLALQSGMWSFGSEVVRSGFRAF